MSWDIATWQKKFRAQPAVWMVVIDGDETPGNIYESEEAAEIEMGWHRKHRALARIQKVNLHSLELSRERWER